MITTEFPYTIPQDSGGDINKVPNDVLINAADGWWYNFGGCVEFRKNGEAYVNVYID